MTTIKTRSKAEILNSSRRRERRDRASRLLLGATLILFLVGGTMALFNLSWLRVTAVTVIGETDTDRVAITAFVKERLAGRWLGLIPRDSVFFLTDNLLAESEFKARFPGLASARVDWINLNALQVAVTDEPSKMLWCVVAAAGKQCYHLAPSGLIYQPAPSFSIQVLTEIETDRPVTTTHQQVIAPAILARVLALVDFVEVNLSGWLPDGWRLLKVETRTANDFALVLVQGDNLERVSRIIFSAEASVEDTAINLNSVLGNEEFLAEWRATGGQLEYLDLRFPGKVFYRFGA